MDLYIVSVVVMRDVGGGEIDLGHCPMVMQAETALSADVLATLRAGRIFPSCEGWNAPGIDVYKLDARFVNGAWRVVDLDELVEDR
jgi:hypothetical protein